MATNTYWGQYTWDAINWGGIATDVNVCVGGTFQPTWGASTWGTGPYSAITPDPNLQLNINAPETQPWGYDAWGIDTWGGAVAPVVIIASANVVPTGT